MDGDDIINGVVVSSEQRDKALEDAFKKTAKDRRRREIEEAEREIETELEISYNSLTSLPEDSVRSDLEFLLEGVAELEPEAKQTFLDALVAQHYGVESEGGDFKELVPYVEIKQQMADFSKLVSSYPAKIRSYRGGKAYKRNEIKNLKVLAKAGIVDTEDVEVYSVALRRVDKALNKWSLESQENEGGRRFLKWNFSALAAYNLGIGAISILTGNPRIMVFSTFSVFDYIALVIGVNEIKGNELKYQAALSRHIQKKGKTLDFDLNIVKTYRQRLLEQVSNPERISKNYLDKAGEVQVRMSQAKEYLKETRDLLDDLKRIV